MIQITSYCLLAGTVFAALALVAYVALLAQRQKAATPASTRAAVPAMSGAPGTPVEGELWPTESGATLERGAEPTTGLALYGSRLTWLALALLTVSLATRAIVTGHGPFANQHEFAVSFAWGIIAAQVYFEWRYRVRSIAVLTLSVAVAILAYSLAIDSEVQPLMPALQNRWLLWLHVATAVLAYGAAAVAFAAAVLYLAKPHLSLKGLPSRELLDEIGYRAAVVAYPLMTVMILLGALWADIAWGRYWSWDPKETSSLVTWLIYGAYLHARVVRDWRGNRAAWLLILGFAAVVFTYFGNLFFGGLHSYA